MEPQIEKWKIDDAFNAAGNLWAASQATGDDASVADVEKLVASLRAIKERQPQPLQTVTLDTCLNVVDVMPCYC